MSKEQVAWRHPNPLLKGYVILPDGYQLTALEAKAKGFSVESWPDDQKKATKCPHDTNEVVLARGLVVNRETAEDAGFKLVDRPLAADQRLSWRTDILSLPEANSRPSAAAELAASISPVSADQARALLRGLPVETPQPKKAEQTTVTNQTDPRAARLAEIRANMGIFNGKRGALPSPRAAASPIANVDATKLKRMAEIRLLGLEQRGQRAEALNLRYALEVHEKTGAPLAGVFHQLGVDTSFVARS